MDIILTHENADFDAVASQLGAHKLWPGATPVLPSRQNRNVRQFLTLYWDELPFIKAEDLPRKPVARVILVDTQHVQTVRGMGKKTEVEVIDHHPYDQSARPGWRITTEPVGANTTLLAERLEASGAELTPVEATLLALGIYEDTGSLSYGKTTPRDIKAAAWLVDHGAMLDMVRSFMRHAITDDQRKLYEQLIHNVEMLDLGGAAILIATAQIDQPIEEIATLAHQMRDLLDPAALFLLVDVGSHIQLVARSTSDVVDVGVVAERLGGGGHDRASAAILKDRSLEEARDLLVAALRGAVRRGLTVADLMSNGVQTLSPSAKARDAHARMRRYGYEGFPVVADGQIAGLVTRRAVDRALDHGLEDVQVDQIMEVGAVSVRPADPISALQHVMMTSGWGQVPVVDEAGRIIGVVTRTDLIKHLGPRRAIADRRAEITARLNAALPPALMAVAAEAGRCAQQMGLHLFVVGGVVRDLLLGYPISDVDFVVEGDAIGLTRALRDAFGGQMRSHARFGTGKWLLDEAVWRAVGERAGVAVDGAKLPAHIDFVTARTEFYSAPTELPIVEQSSIKHDLHRRDFTINTLAIQLDPPALGSLLDFYGGERDLAEKRIRVLHSISFVDDPTRILRAARLEQRLGFQIDARTEELIGHALPMLEKVSGDRIRRELDTIFEENEPEAALSRLSALGVLQTLHPSLTWDESLRGQYVALRAARAEPLWPELASLDLTLPYFGVLTSRLPHEVVLAICQRLKVRRRTVLMLDRLRALSPEMDVLDGSLRPSEVDRMLFGANDWVLAAAWALAPGQQAKDHIVDYAVRLRHVRSLADGQTLVARGCKPGPDFKRVLERLRVAWLDGEVQDAAQESDLMDRLLAEPAPAAES